MPSKGEWKAKASGYRMAALTLVVVADGYRLERDRARDVAVALEQELAHVTDLMDALAADLIEMDAVKAIDLDSWPAAAAVVAHVSAT